MLKIVTLICASFLITANGMEESLEKDPNKCNTSDSTIMNNTTYTAGSAMEAGVWGLSLVHDTSYRFELTNGVNTYISKVDNSAINNDGINKRIAGEFYFENGFKINLTKELGQDYGGLNIDQAGKIILINITKDEKLTRIFQIGEKAYSNIGMTFNAMTTATLGLNGADIKSKDNA